MARNVIDRAEQDDNSQDRRFNAYMAGVEVQDTDSDDEDDDKPQPRRQGRQARRVQYSL